MDLLIEFGKIILPSLAVLYAMYLTVKMFIQRDWDNKRLEIGQESIKTTLPLRLQAYERMALFLERISPNNLIVRLNDGKFTSGQLQQVLLSEIREEFNHNLSQQIYLSDEAWSMIRNAMENIVVAINEAGTETDREEKGIALARRIFDKYIAQEKDPIQEALLFVKAEVRDLF